MRVSCRLLSAFLCAVLIGWTAGAVAEKDGADTVRRTVELRGGWSFAFGEIDAGVVKPGFDDSSWERVTVPHSWNRVGYYVSEKDHIHTPQNIDKRQGIGWYRLSFTAPDENYGTKRAWLEFDAASRTAEVWLNGTRLGEHRGGFTRFRFDATDAIKSGGNNVLVVKTDNTQPSPTSSTADTLPISGDFFVHGGLYRPVRLVLVNSVHIDLADFGGPGVYATTTQIRRNRAKIDIRSRLRNDGAEAQEIEVVTSLVSANGSTAARNHERLTLDAGRTVEVEQTLEVVDPVLWDGVKNPHLYSLLVELISPSGEVLDSLHQQYGIRQMRLDPDRGFLLNGKPMRLLGAGYHQDREGKGWAMSRADIEEDVRMLRDMGANTLRLSHYPHGQPVHELANEYGLVLWDEIPLVSSWSYGLKHQEANDALAANAKQQLVEMIRQNFNHPSVAVWGIGNELDWGVVMPTFLGTAEHADNDPLPLLRELALLASKEDSTRPSTIANCCEEREEVAHIDLPTTSVTAEAAGANRYFGWYYGVPSDLGPHLDLLRELRPDQPLSVSEYGAGGATSLHTDDPLGGPVDERGHDQPEEYMSYVHEGNWRSMAERTYLWGIWLWNAFDFATTVRREGDAVDINTKGLITYDRKVKKDSYYFYKANWSDSPTVHITGRRYIDRAYPVTDLRIYSNAEVTEVFVNGVSIGERQSCPERICEWAQVKLQGGRNEIEARGKFGSLEVHDSVEWKLAATRENAYYIDTGTLIAAPAERDKRYGSDAFFSGGEAKSVDIPGGWGKPATEAAIAGTDSRKLVATYREGEFTYRLPVENGSYRVTLLFMEPGTAVGERTFDVIANGEPAIEAFDVAAAAGGTLTAVSRQFSVSVTENVLELIFKPKAGAAVISAIEVTPVER